MSGHTKGPWAVVDGHYPSMREIQGPSFKINIVMSATDLNFQDYLSRSADANLIAAAPELLEALMASTHARHSNIDGDPCLCSQCRFVLQRDAAIAKAKGEQPK